MCAGIVRSLVALCRPAATAEAPVYVPLSPYSPLPMQDDDNDDTEAGYGSLDMFMAVPIRVIAI